jgi:hypothetical protein
MAIKAACQKILKGILHIVNENTRKTNITKQVHFQMRYVKRKHYKTK